MKLEIQYPEKPPEQPPANTSAATPTLSERIEIFVVMEGGLVHEIVNLPPNINVTVIDDDTEGVERERLEISPLDGELCVINKW